MAIYKYVLSKMYISQPCARRANRNYQTYILPPRVGMIYPIPTYSTDTCSPNCWQHISNTNGIFEKCTIPNSMPEGHTETLQLREIMVLIRALPEFAKKKKTHPPIRAPWSFFFRPTKTTFCAYDGKKY